MLKRQPHYGGEKFSLTLSALYRLSVTAVKNSFAKVPQITDAKWHEEIMSNLIR